MLGYGAHLPLAIMVNFTGDVHLAQPTRQFSSLYSVAVCNRMQAAMPKSGNRFHFPGFCSAIAPCIAYRDVGEGREQERKLRLKRLLLVLSALASCFALPRPWPRPVSRPVTGLTFSLDSYLLGNHSLRYSTSYIHVVVHGPGQSRSHLLPAVVTPPAKLLVSASLLLCASNCCAR
jgi:hypothetical protein